jgi:hypothetical protein
LRSVAAKKMSFRVARLMAAWNRDLKVNLLL